MRSRVTDAAAQNDSSATKCSSTCFHAKRAPTIGIEYYLSRIREFFACSDTCFVLALIYIDRAGLPISGLTCHRLLLTSIMLAAKFHDDWGHFTITQYGQVGGVRAEEMAKLELEFLRLVDWRLSVEPLEYDKYLSVLRRSAPDCGN
jgi:hypothetical protein